MSSTFSGFYVAKSGIQAARANLQVTGQNMANVNTKGYTRQRVDSYAIPSSGNGMRYASGEIGIGEGVYCSGVSQIRDPYLDIRYRAEHAKTGKTETQLDTLQDITSIFDETTKDGISAQFADLIKQLKTLGATPSDYNLEGIVKSSAQLLTKAFNTAANKLTEIRKQQTDSLQNDEITNVNSLLKNIAHLNEEIKSSDISGTSALELIDQRNTMIDELSKYANIKVSSKQVDIGSGRSVSELHIDLVSGDKSFSLVSDNKFSSLGMTTDVDTGISMVLKDTDGNDVQAKDADGNVMHDGGGSPYTMANADLTEGTFSGYLTMLNENGEFDAANGTERGIGYYENVLNKLAVSFADIMNKANSTNPPANDNKPLFSTTDGKPMAAGNICLSSEWNTSTSAYVTNTKQAASPGVDPKTVGDNILYMVNQLEKDTTYKTGSDNVSGKTLFTTSIKAYISDVSVSVLGLQKKDITTRDKAYNSTLNEIDTQRASHSSVDVNEEGINLIMYNQSLTASSRVMTTLDEALDTIINKMGLAGR